MDAIGRVGVGHVGGSLSVAEALVVLYYRHMRIDPRNPRMDLESPKHLFGQGYLVFGRQLAENCKLNITKLV